MRRLTGCDYGYRGLLGAALVHLPIVRLFVTADVDDDDADRRPPFCSQACVLSDGFCDFLSDFQNTVC